MKSQGFQGGFNQYQGPKSQDSMQMKGKDMFGTDLQLGKANPISSGIGIDQQFNLQ